MDAAGRKAGGFFCVFEIFFPKSLFKTPVEKFSGHFKLTTSLSTMGIRRTVFMNFRTLDVNCAINPDWIRVIINFETKNVFELAMVRKMISGKNGVVDLDSLIPHPENLVHFLEDEEYEALSAEQKAEYDRAVEENRIGNGWERINWGCDINADDARWTATSTVKFDVTGYAPKKFLEKLAEKLNEEGIEFHGFAVPDKFRTCKELRFASMNGKVDYGFPENFRTLICEEWDISKEEADDILGPEQTESRKVIYQIDPGHGKPLPPPQPKNFRRDVFVPRKEDGGFIPKAVKFLYGVFG